jgi:hypothetical protein
MYTRTVRVCPCRALPGPSEVMSSITMPKAYLTILQDSSMVRLHFALYALSSDCHAAHPKPLPTTFA